MAAIMQRTQSSLCSQRRQHSKGPSPAQLSVCAIASRQPRASSHSSTVPRASAHPHHQAPASRAAGHVAHQHRHAAPAPPEQASTIAAPEPEQLPEDAAAAVAAGQVGAAVASQGGEAAQGQEQHGEVQQQEQQQGEGEQEGQQEQQQEAVEVEEVTEEESEEPEQQQQQTPVQLVASRAQTFFTTTKAGKAIAIGSAVLLAGTFALALYRYWQKYNSDRAKRNRQVNRNKLLVEELSKYLPGGRERLSAGVVRGLRSKTGFTPVEVFRKYLWYLLRERKFDQIAVDDLVALKGALGLSDDDVAEALKERAQRVYDKYGTLMMNTEGMTAGGVERKATCVNLFRKLLYLTDYDALLTTGSEAAASVDVRKVFGALDEDIDRLRIVSLHEVDLESAFNKEAASASASAAGEEEEEA